MRAILTYHSIDSSGSPISVDPDAFGRHVAWLASGRVTVTTIDGLLSLPASADAVAITFDDGFANFEEVAAPRLLEHGFPVTLFVVTDHVGRTNAWRGRPESGIPQMPLLGWASLARLQERGVVLGAHTRSHADLTHLDPAAIEDEVLGSADCIERETGSRPMAFAYPYGRIDDDGANIVGKVFRYACTTEFRTLEHWTPDPVRLPRLDMYCFRESERLIEWGSPAVNRFIGARRRLRQLRQLF